VTAVAFGPGLFAALLIPLAILALVIWAIVDVAKRPTSVLSRGAKTAWIVGLVAGTCCSRSPGGRRHRLPGRRPASAGPLDLRGASQQVHLGPGAQRQPRLSRNDREDHPGAEPNRVSTSWWYTKPASS